MLRLVVTTVFRIVKLSCTHDVYVLPMPNPGGSPPLFSLTVPPVTPTLINDVLLVAERE